MSIKYHGMIIHDERFENLRSIPSGGERRERYPYSLINGERATELRMEFPNHLIASRKIDHG